MSRLTNTLPLASSLIATNWILSQSNNISYGTRGVVRVDKTPDDRKGDYFFRDFFMVWVCGYIMEGAFRALDKFYYSPLMTHALQLHQLNQVPHPHLKQTKQDKPQPLYPTAQSYSSLPETFRMRAMGSLVRSASRSLVPQVLMENALEDLKKTAPPTMSKQLQVMILEPNINPNLLQETLREKYKKQHEGKNILDEDLNALVHSLEQIAYTDNPARREKQLNRFLAQYAAKPNSLSARTIRDAVLMEHTRQTGILLDYLYRTLDFKGYLQKMLVPRGELKHQEADHIWNTIETEFKKDSGKSFAKSGLSDSVQELKKTGSAEEKIAGYIREGLSSQAKRHQFAQIQKSGTWPKIISVVLLNFIVYGWLATQFDNKKLQPFQSKVVDRHDTSQPLATAGFMGFLPALGVFVTGMWDRFAPGFIRRMDHFNRFMTVGSSALITFGLVWYKSLQALLNRQSNRS